MRLFVRDCRFLHTRDVKRTFKIICMQWNLLRSQKSSQFYKKKDHFTISCCLQQYHRHHHLTKSSFQNKCIFYVVFFVVVVFSSLTNWIWRQKNVFGKDNLFSLLAFHLSNEHFSEVNCIYMWTASWRGIRMSYIDLVLKATHISLWWRRLREVLLLGTTSEIQFAPSLHTALF